MPFHMSLQTCIIGKHIEANNAGEHGTANVDFAMTGQILRCGKALTAHLTHKRLALAVVATVHNQLITKLEHLATNIAHMRTSRNGRAIRRQRNARLTIDAMNAALHFRHKQLTRRRCRIIVIVIIIVVAPIITPIIVPVAT